MNKKQLRKYIQEESKYLPRHGHMIGTFPDSTPYEIDKVTGSRNKYIVTLFEHKKPTFKIGNKTFIVS